MDDLVGDGYLVVTILVNCGSFRRAYRVTTLMAHSVGVRLPPPTPVLRHHLLMMAAYLSRFISTYSTIQSNNLFYLRVCNR